MLRGSEKGTVEQTLTALLLNEPEAILVLARDEEPIGWIEADPEELTLAPAAATAGDLVSEHVTGISPDCALRPALYALSLAGTTRLLVRTRGDRAGIGTLTKEDS